MEQPNDVPFRLEGRIAIVTGSGRGIGRAIALIFARAGANVVVATRTAGPGEETVRMIDDAGGTGILIATDLSSRAAAESLIAETIARFGALDIIVHNAAVFPIVRIEDLSDEELETTFAVNLKAAFWLAKAGVPHLRQARSPRLLFTSSVTGPRVALPGLAHYAASKAGLIGFARVLAREVAPFGITVNTIAPTRIDTDMAKTFSNLEAVENAYVRAIPLARIGRPADVAHCVAYLASAEAGFMTGAILDLTGGQFMA